jgi:PAS domain S-box-containing protein
MENLPGLAWMKDLDGRYLYVNGPAARAFNYPVERIVGRTDFELFPEETARQFRANDDRGLEQGGVLVVERLTQDDEVEHHSLVSKFPIADEEGDVMAVGGIAIDITDRIQAEEALKLADRRKDEYVAMLAHELRNPLSPIVTATEVLRLRSGGDAMIERQRDIIHRQVGQMRRLLDDLLDVSRITRGKVRITREPLELADVLKQALETSRPQIEAGRHTFDVSLPGEPMPVYGDAARLAQVFTNLLNNAAKFTDPGGDIRLEARRDVDQVRVSVRDNGVGMSPELVAGAFELFRQGADAFERSTSGLGIGLTLVRRLVEAHGGTVTASSAGLGAGSEFVVRLPLFREREDQAAAL